MTHPDNVVLRTAGSRTRADEWALVLAAEGLSPSVRRERGVFAVRLPVSQVEAATEALATYERENPPVPERDVTPAEQHRSSRAGTLVAAALLLFFLVSGPRDAGSPWFEAGSADAGRIVDGEFWRVVTALTLHSNIAHVAANAIMGAILVNAACAVLGNGLGLAAVLLAGAGGNWINAWMQPAVHSSVGASTAVFAALGLLCGPALSRLRTRGVRGGRLLAPLGAGLGVIAMLGVGGAQTDLWAHLFGFAVGVALGLPLAARAPRLRGLPIQLGCGALALATLLLSWSVAWIRPL